MKTLCLIAAALAAAAPGFAQSKLQVSATAGGTTATLAAGGSVALTAADIGQPALATITVRNNGTAAASITGVSVAGTAEMSLVFAPAFPVTLAAGVSSTFSVQYLPASGNAVVAQIAIGFVENSLPGTFPLSVTGTSPRLTYSYSVAPAAAVNDLVSGGAISFAGVNAGSTATAVVNVLNHGTAPATVQSAAVTGAGFQLSGSHGPIAVAAGTQATFFVLFAPQFAGGSQGLLSLTLGSGNIVSFSLTGNGTSSGFTAVYTLADGNAHPLTDGTSFVFPTIDVTGTSTATIDILNQGTGAGMLNAVTLSGAGFRLSGVPLLPATIAAGQSLRFSIIFAPPQSGAFNGAFRIDLGGRSISGGVSGSTTTPNLSVTYALADGVANSLSNGTAIAFATVDINATSTATIEIANHGQGAGTVSAIAVSGAGFRLSGSPALPATVAAGQSLRFGIVFAPTQAGAYSGAYRIDFSGTTVAGALAASTATSNILLSYIDPDTNNIVPLRDGGTLPFPTTVTGSTTAVSLLVSNTGAGTGVIDSIAVSATGPSFALLNLPALPASVPPGQQLKFGVRFSPQQQQAVSGALLVSVNGRVTTVTLQAQGSGAQFTYAYGANATPAAPGGAIALGETTVGQSGGVTVSVANNGNADGQIATIAITGAGFSLADLPLLPATVKAGGSQSFTVNFAPTQPGPASGRLTIGGDSFALSAAGIGSRLTYSYTSASTPIAVQDGGAVIFPPLQVGKSEKLQFALQNTGTSAATISSISISGTGAVFALDGLPALPFSLAAGATASFNVSFAPSTTGGLTAALRIDNTGFTLSGSGTQPAALPSYQFQTPAGSAQPAQQPAIGLTLAAPYSLPIDGTFKLTFISSVFTDDPAIQFASGGRTVSFTIPANSTQALFNGSPSMPLQTGTTAGTIVITPSFTMRGGFDLTPVTPDALTLAIPRTAPQLVSASISSATATSFTLVLSGYSTSRGMRQFDIQFTPKAGETFSATKLTLDVSTAASGWYQSAASQGSGGSFLATIPFLLANGSSTDDLVHRLQSLSVTATNETGVSTAVTVPIQ